MTITIRPELIADLKRDEGCVLHAYPDPLTHADPWTIGYGHTGPEVHKGLLWTQADADNALRHDAQKHAEELVKSLPWVINLDPIRQDVLFNMAFNMGVKGLLKFKNTLAFIQIGKYKNAASNMLASLWTKQVGERADRLANMINYGKR